MAAAEAGRGVSLHPTHDVGIWVGALLTLCIFSFLYKDNPLYKFAEHLFVGVSIGYVVMQQYYNVLLPNLFERLTVDDHFASFNLDGFTGQAGDSLDVLEWSRLHGRAGIIVGDDIEAIGRKHTSPENAFADQDAIAR